MGMTKTWLKKESWRKIKGKMSKIFRWYCILARRENMKGRAKGDIMIAADRSLKEIDFRELSHDVAEITFKYNRNSWRVIMVYSQDIEKTAQ